jgi:hypothetical protein
MSAVFVQQFLVAPLPADRPELELRYDDVRQLNLTADETPFVALGRAGGTDTLTEVRSEADDYDQPGDGDELALSTVTKAAGERDDFAADLFGLDTETRMPGEKDDFARELVLGTYTAVGGEPDDDDVEVRAFEDRGSTFDTATKTSVRGEADDFWSDEDDTVLVAPALLRP